MKKLFLDPIKVYFKFWMQKNKSLAIHVLKSFPSADSVYLKLCSTTADWYSIVKKKLELILLWKKEKTERSGKSAHEEYEDKFEEIYSSGDKWTSILADK